MKLFSMKPPKNLKGFQLLLILMSGLAKSPSFANDAVASIGVGGLTLSKSEEIMMQEETLHITPDRIQVHYVFANESAETKKVVVAFPLPPLDFFSGELGGIHEWPESKKKTPLHLLGFTTLVDGKKIVPQVSIKAILPDPRGEEYPSVDVTPNLKQLKLPLYPLDPQFAKAFAALSEVQKKEMKKSGLLSEDGYQMWLIQVTFYWGQAFPSKRPLRISHSYQPISGMAYYTKGSQTSLQKQFCADPSIFPKLDTILDQDPEKFPIIPLISVDYILLSAKTWKGPIKNFHLILEKKRSTDFMFLCAPSLDLKKTSPTRFEATKEDFVPSGDLHILFIKMPKS